MDSVFRALWFATQSVNILHYSLIHLQFLRASDAKLTQVESKMPSRFAAIPNYLTVLVYTKTIIHLSVSG